MDPTYLERRNLLPTAGCFLMMSDGMHTHTQKLTEFHLIRLVASPFDAQVK